MPIVVLKDIAFTPPVVHVRKGGHVTWRWDDPYVTHNVTSRGTRRFPSSRDRRQGTYRVTFKRRGTYRYVCTLHPGMKGKVVVGRARHPDPA